MTRDEKVENIRADVMTIREVMDELRISRQFLNMQRKLLKEWIRECNL